MPDIEPKQSAQERADRLLHFIKERYTGNRSAFARKAGMLPQRLNDYLPTDDPDKEIKSPGAEKLRGFQAAGLNTEWYISGIGEMDSETSPFRTQPRPDTLSTVLAQFPELARVLPPAVPQQDLTPLIEELTSIATRLQELAWQLKHGTPNQKS